MMGLPGGWVTGVPGLSRKAMVKMLGNGVVPQQIELAIRIMLPALPDHVLAALGAPGQSGVRARDHEYV
jgi:DNA (cytosine-5)-methyltransferase 1